MASHGKRKRMHTTTTEDIDISLSDLEEDGMPVVYAVERLSKDRRRIIREEGRIVVSSDTEGSTREETDSNDVPDYSWDLGLMDVEGLTGDASSKGLKDSKKRRYVSAVRRSGIGSLPRSR